jgi:hypothetical protein
LSALPDNQKILLAGPDADKLYQILLDGNDGKLSGRLELASVPAQGYAGVLLDIAEKTNIFGSDNSAWLFAGPEYVRKSDAEINNPALQVVADQVGDNARRPKQK